MHNLVYLLWSEILLRHAQDLLEVPFDLGTSHRGVIYDAGRRKRERTFQEGHGSPRHRPEGERGASVSAVRRDAAVRRPAPPHLKTSTPPGTK